MANLRKQTPIEKKSGISSGLKKVASSVPTQKKKVIRKLSNGPVTGAVTEGLAKKRTPITGNTATKKRTVSGNTATKKYYK